jgi:hypothetical protein
VDPDATGSESLDRLLIAGVGMLVLADERLGAGLNPERPIRAANTSSLLHPTQGIVG